jgi:tetratricopeptide (TPR) repeat protein
MAARTAPQGSPEIAKLAQKLAKDPKSKVFVQLAEEYVKAGLFQEAIMALEDGLKVFPTFVTARVALGRVYHQIGEAAKAKTMLEEAVKLSPDNLLAHRMLARLYADEGAFEPALRSCSVVLGANSKDGEIVELRRGIEQAQRQQAVPATGMGDSSAATLPSGHAADDAGPDSRETKRESVDDSHAPNRHAQAVARLRTLLATVQERRVPSLARRSE